jgi:oligosaccharide 4-alpha-D-glucosyltransferase
MTRLLALLSVCLLATTSFSQNKITTPTGSWSFQQYAPNILKVAFQPNQYKTNENLSDAVILKPKQEITTVVKQNNDTLFFGNDKRVAIITTNNANGYNGFKFLLHNNERIFGGGERALPLNRRGYKFDLYNQPAYVFGINK